MAFTVYAIRSLIDSRIYVGFTENLDRRLEEHNKGRTRSTKGYRPWKLNYKEEVKTRISARKLEKYYKGGCGKEILKEID